MDEDIPFFEDKEELDEASIPLFEEEVAPLTQDVALPGIGGSVSFETEEEDIPVVSEDEGVTPSPVPEPPVAPEREENFVERSQGMDLPPRIKELNKYNEVGLDQPDLFAPERDYPYSPYYNDGPAPQAGAEPAKKQDFLTKEEILKSPEQMKIIREYMIDRMGAQYTSEERTETQAIPRGHGAVTTSVIPAMSDEQVVDDFITHMRYMNTNEITTSGELISILRADEEQRARWGEAYSIYEQFGRFDQTDTGGAIKDYAVSMITSPSTWAGGLVGRAIAKAPTKAAQKKIMDVALKEVTEAAVKKGGKEAAIQARKVFAMNATKYNAYLAAGAAAVTDGVMTAGWQDASLQRVMMLAGQQDKYSIAQGALTALTGVVGGGLAGAVDAFRGTVKLKDAGIKIDASVMEKQATSLRRFGPRMKEAVKKWTADWEKSVSTGKALDPDRFTRDNAVNWFFDLANENSFVRIIQETGVKLPEKSTLSESVLEFVGNLPNDLKNDWNEAFKPLGVTFGEMMDIFASVMNEGGTQLGKASQASKFLNEYEKVKVAKKQAAEGLLNSTEELEKIEIPASRLAYAQSLWKRGLVSVLSTTMTNIKGYVGVRGARAISETLHAGLLGTSAMVGGVLGRDSARALAQSNALLKNQIFSLKTFVDPYTSMEAFAQIIERFPKKYSKEALSTFYSGVKEEGAEAFGLGESKVAKRLDYLYDKAAALSFIRWQDLMTKSLSGIQELDKQVRLKHGVGLEEFINSGRGSEIDDDMADRVIKALMSDTLSTDHTKGKDPINKLAGLVEKASNTPGIGFVVPFGRFMNDALAFSYVYSPLGLTHYYGKYSFFKGWDETEAFDLQSKVMKGIVGTLGLAYATLSEREKEAQGLQWYEERGENGEIVNQQNLFPLSPFKVLGRAIHMHQSGQGVPLDFQLQIAEQLGSLSLAKGVDATWLKDISKEFSDPENQGAGSTPLLDIISAAVGSIVGTVASGYTRPVDPLNDMFGFIGETEGLFSGEQVDKKQATGLMDQVVFGLTRYTDNFFKPFLEEGPVKQSSLQEGPVTIPNAVSEVLGTKVLPAKTNIDRLLGMVNMPPWRAESFSGHPEYDAFMNDTIFPELERVATNTLDSPLFKAMPPYRKRQFVQDQISKARDRIVDDLEGGLMGTEKDRLAVARRNLMLRPKGMVVQAKEALGITTPTNELTQFQIDAIIHAIDMQRDLEKAYEEQF